MATAAVAALVLPFWLGACTGPGSSTGTAAGGQAATPQDRIAPVPEAQQPPSAGSSANTAPASGASPDTSPGASPGSSVIPGTGAGGAGSAGQGEAAVPGTAPASGENQASAAPAPPPPAASASGNAAASNKVTAYYVLLDDGGSGGVRFGCNDSLVGVHLPAAGATEPLPAAMRALLDGSEPPVAGAYNSLSASTLQYLAGSFDGTTVTVYLAGTIRPGGVCDIPRVEAQLTQTAVASVGAIRTEIYVNGVSLTEVLSLK